jgi:8-amino-7-oxononanoate synthase
MPSESLETRLAAALRRRQLNGNLRSLDPPGYDPSGLVDFSSNDYLALSKATKLSEAFQQALGKSQNAPYGPASSRLLDGNSHEHLKLEKRLATFFHGESALLFNSGFDANAGVFACLPAENDVVLYDELIHASAHDGMRASRCKTRLSFKHNDPIHLGRVIEKILASDKGQVLRSGSIQLFVAVESLYSMDGDLAPLLRFVETIEELLPGDNGHLIVDEAHSTGLYGHQGRGLVCALGLEHRVLVRLHTFGKALACSGGERMYLLASMLSCCLTHSFRCHTM